MSIKVTKTSIVLKLLKRAKGAKSPQLQTATGWQPHSVRAALTGLRKTGHIIQRDKDARGNTVYRLISEAK